jgi:hypothetical protein
MQFRHIRLSILSSNKKKTLIKGRWPLRKYLYLMSVSAVNHRTFFRKYYQRRLKTKNRFGQLLKKKEALCAVAIKLIKVIFALLRDKRAIQDTVRFSLAA